MDSGLSNKHAQYFALINLKLKLRHCAEASSVLLINLLDLRVLSERFKVSVGVTLNLLGFGWGKAFWCLILRFWGQGLTTRQNLLGSDGILQFDALGMKIAL